MTRLAILRRSVVDERGCARVERLVDCPRGDGCVPLSSCDRCGHLRAEFVDDETGGYALECAHEGAIDPTTAAFRAEIRVVPVLAVASHSVIGVDANASTDLVRLALTRNAVGCVVVMDRLGAPLGVVTAIDLLERADARTAADVLRRAVVTVRGMTPITRAAAVMAYEGIHHLPVVNDLGEVIAVLSSLDVLRHLAKEGGFILGDESTRALLARDCG